MFDTSQLFTLNKDNYSSSLPMLQGILYGDDDLTSRMSNTSAFIFEYFKNINWVGFYLLKGDQLVLGPFQGKVACNRIKLTKGVCAKSAITKETVVVENVLLFPGHIACDAQSRSEIVVPLFYNDQLIAVLDIDSEQYNRFGDAEKVFFEQIAKLLTDY